MVNILLIATRPKSPGLKSSNALGMGTVLPTVTLVMPGAGISHERTVSVYPSPRLCGEILAALSIAAWRFSLLNVLIVVLFVVIQLLRSKWEEDKLSRIFPDYKSYAAKTIWFWQR